MRSDLPLITNLCRRLRAEVELAVLRFAKRHRDLTGRDLRQQAAQIARLADRAWHQPEMRAEWVAKLVDAVDDFKLTLQLGADVHAFASRGQFQALQLLVGELGKQCGGWHRHQKNNPKGQSPAPRAAQERATILSTRDASAEAMR